MQSREAVSAPAGEGHDAPAPPFTPAYARYALGLLFVVYVFNFLDRQILSILLEPIKQEFGLSDGQLGLLGGVAFALVYSTAGIPVARWADVGVRRTIVAIGLTIWSLMTAAQGLARGFGTLLAARIGVGLGESACSPPAHSLISDFFPPDRRATALAIYALGIPIGSALGYLTGGWIEQFFGWRTAFLVVGLPGVLLALVVRLTLKEPPRGHWEGFVEKPASEQISLGETLRFLTSRRSFLHFSLAGALHAFAGYGAGYFNPTFFIRSHEMTSGAIGTWFFFIGLVAALGTFLGGALTDRLAPRDRRWYMWLPAIATATAVPIAAAFYLLEDATLALLVGFPQAIVGPMYLGPTFAMTQAIARPDMRALASAILLFILNSIGLGLGPWFVGVLSDWLAPGQGQESLRVALVWVVCICNAWATVHYLVAARYLRADLAASES